MSGPIVRKYGFPNFEKIFGPRPVLHGVDEEGPDAEGNDAPARAPAPASATGTKPERPRDASEGEAGPAR